MVEHLGSAQPESWLVPTFLMMMCRKEFRVLAVDLSIA